MSIDLEKLTPAPWGSERRSSNGREIVPRIICERSKDRECGWIADLVGAPYLGYESTLVNAEFIALARNALDVMMRRRWYVSYFFRSEKGKHFDKWLLHCGDDEEENMLEADGKLIGDDPFTTLDDADQWMKENGK
jgi:hypothetical protein